MIIVKNFIDIVVANNDFHLPQIYSFEGTIEDVYKMPLPKDIDKIKTYQKACDITAFKGRKIIIQSDNFNEKTYEVAKFYTLDEAKKDKLLKEKIKEIEKNKKLTQDSYYSKIKGFYVKANGYIKNAEKSDEADNFISTDKLTLNDEEFYKLKEFDEFVDYDDEKE